MTTALALVALLLGANSFEGRVVAVHDGDTITVLRNHEQLRIRLEGIDCPELAQAFGRAAKKFTSDKLFRRTVTVRPYTTDEYGRTVARVVVGGKDVSLELVRAGLAWHYTRFNQDRELADAEREARKARLGLWQDRDPIPPWEWRRTKRSTP